MQKALRQKVYNYLRPISISSVLIGPDRNAISMRNYQHATILLNVGTVASAGNTFTIQQCKNVEGGGAKALAFDRYYYSTGNASPAEDSDQWQEVVSGTLLTIAATSYMVEVDARMLDVDNRFDCIRPSLDSVASANLVSIVVILSNPRYTGRLKANQPSAMVN